MTAHFFCLHVSALRASAGTSACNGEVGTAQPIPSGMKKREPNQSLETTASMDEVDQQADEIRERLLQPASRGFDVLPPCHGRLGPHALGGAAVVARPEASGEVEEVIDTLPGVTEIDTANVPAQSQPVTNPPTCG